MWWRRESCQSNAWRDQHIRMKRKSWAATLSRFEGSTEVSTLQITLDKLEKLVQGLDRNFHALLAYACRLQERHTVMSWGAQRAFIYKTCPKKRQGQRQDFWKKESSSGSKSVHLECLAHEIRYRDCCKSIKWERFQGNISSPEEKGNELAHDPW